MFPCHCPDSIHIPSVLPERNPGHGQQIVMDIGIGSDNNNTSVIVKHHLLDFILSPGEHPLRVGT